MDKELKEAFSVSFKTGFLSEEPPLARLPEPFRPWEELIQNFNDLLKSKSLRKEVDENLPLITVSDYLLPTERHWQRACKILTFLAHGYVWQEGEEAPISTLPKQLAVPWWEVTQRLGLPTVATYAAVVLWNWRLKDSNGPIVPDNMEIETLFTGTPDEDWFFMVSIFSEIVTGKAIREGWKCLEEVKNNCIPKVIECLDVIVSCIQEVTVILDKMYEKCKPETFYNHIRVFLSGSKDMGGLLFEGVSTEPKEFITPSAAQSSPIPYFDVLLGVERNEMIENFLNIKKWCMPRPHRQFLLAISLKPSIRAFVIANKSNDSLVKSYNRCIEALAEFRNRHIVIVTRYIVLPFNKAKSIGKSDQDQVMEQEGKNEEFEGGGPMGALIGLLKSSRDETLKCCV